MVEIRMPEQGPGGMRPAPISECNPVQEQGYRYPEEEKCLLKLRQTPFAQRTLKDEQPVNQKNQSHQQAPVGLILFPLCGV
jgi:hypothetical protein